MWEVGSEIRRLLFYKQLQPLSVSIDINPAKRVPVTHVGKLTFQPSGETCERIIVGELIDDSERTAFTSKDPDSLFVLPFYPGVRAGSIGFIDFQITTQAPQASLYIAHVGVETNFRRKGFGTSLRKIAEQEAIKRGVNRVWSHIDVSDSESLVPLVTKMGYSVEKINPRTFISYKNL